MYYFVGFLWKLVVLGDSMARGMAAKNGLTMGKTGKWWSSVKSGGIQSKLLSIGLSR